MVLCIYRIIFLKICKYLNSSSASGVTMTTNNTTWDVAKVAGLPYVCVLHGVTENMTISVEASDISSTYDYVTCKILVQ